MAKSNDLAAEKGVPAGLAELALIALAGSGIFITGSLWLEHMGRIDLPCGKGLGCGTVLNSPLSTPGGIPLAGIGLMFYVLLGFLAIVRIYGKGSYFGTLAMLTKGLVYAGAAVSLMLTAYSIVILKSVCLWCLSSTCVVLLSLIPATFLSADFDMNERLRSQAGILAAMAWSLSTTGLILLNRNWQTAEPFVNRAALASASVNELLPPGSPAIGNRRSPTKVVVFLDFLCGSCRLAYPVLLRQVRQGRSMLVVRFLPNARSEAAMEASKLALIATVRGMGESFLDTELRPESSSRSKADFLATWHRLLGPSEPTRHEWSLASQMLEVDLALAQRLDIRQTPTALVVFADGTAQASRVSQVHRLLD